jgi:hypothetical protein
VMFTTARLPARSQLEGSLSNSWTLYYHARYVLFGRLRSGGLPDFSLTSGAGASRAREKPRRLACRRQRAGLGTRLPPIPAAPHRIRRRPGQRPRRLRGEVCVSCAGAGQMSCSAVDARPFLPAPSALAHLLLAAGMPTPQLGHRRSSPDRPSDAGRAR